MSYKRHLETLVATGRCKEFLGKNFTYEDLNRMGLEEIKKWYMIYETVQGSKLTEHLSYSVLKLYTKSCSHFLKIDNENELYEDLRNDYLIKNELLKWGGYLALRLGSAMSLLSTTLITFSHIAKSETGATEPDERS